MTLTVGGECLRATAAVPGRASIRLAVVGRCPDEFARRLRENGVWCRGEADTNDKLTRLATGALDALVCFADDAHDDIVRLLHGVAGRWFTVVVGRREWPHSHAIIRAGADAYLVWRNPGDYATLIAMVTAAVPSRPGPSAGHGGPLATLSDREREALAYVAAGYTHQQTANRMRISKSTVDTFITRIRAKLGVGNKAELAALALLAPPMEVRQPARGPVR